MNQSLRSIISKHIEANWEAESRHKYEMKLDQIYGKEISSEFHIGDTCYLDSVVKIISVQKHFEGDFTYHFELRDNKGNCIIHGFCNSSCLVPTPKPNEVGSMGIDTEGSLITAETDRYMV